MFMQHLCRFYYSRSSPLAFLFTYFNKHIQFSLSRCVSASDFLGVQTAILNQSVDRFVGPGKT